MSDEVWYKDPKTGELYQDRRERGKIVRVYRKAPRKSSTSRGEPSSIRSEQPSNPRPRRDSVVSRGSDTISTGRYQTQGGTSSKRETSIRPEDGGRGSERTETTYISDNRGYGRQDDAPDTYGDRQTHSSYRDSQRTYHPAGGYNSQQGYTVPVSRDSADDLAGQMQNLSTANYYTPQPVTSSLPVPTAYADTTAYGTLDSNPANYGQASTAQSVLPPRDTAPDRQVRGTPHLGDSEKLDKSYKIRNTDYRKFFKIGRVFATLWTEGVGNNVKIDQTFVSEVVYKERVHSKIRRFVVVRERDRSVLCLPVTSYSGAGPKKPGIRLGEHGFIYSKNSPRKVDEMLSRSLKVILSRGANAKDLTDPSLVNYGKVYTVETNVKVKDIGDLDADSKAILMHYFKRVLFSGDSDLPSGIEDTPTQTNAILAGIGGAASDLTATSQYTTAVSATGYPPSMPYQPSGGQDMTRGYGPSTQDIPNPSGYATAQDTRQASYGSTYQPASVGTWNITSSDTQMPRADREPNYQLQPGPAYSATPTGSSYPTGPTYGSTVTGAAGYNTAQYSTAYPSSDARYTNIPPASTSPYVANYSYTPRTSVPYSSEPVSSGNPYYQQQSSSHIASDGGYYASYPATSDPQTSYYPPAIDDRDDNIRLPTLQEEQERRRRESNAGTSRERDRRHRR